MQNKGLIIFLTVLITLLCIYFLSFTYVSNNVKKDATAYATDDSGVVDFRKKDQYLDSISKEVVYDIGVTQYTFEEVQNTELNLGLDLRGGMSVTMEVSPTEILKGISGYNQDSKFLEAISMAKERQKTTQGTFVELFYGAFQEINPGVQLNTVFANAANKDRIDFDSDDSAVLALINTEVDDAVNRAFNILRTRLDRFGTSQPNIQKLQGTGRIQIELPGVENKERVRKLLQGVAKLEFWEVYNFNEYGASLTAINELIVREQQAKLALAKSDSPAETIDQDLGSLSAEIDTSGVSVEDEVDSNDLEAQLVGIDSDSTSLDSLDSFESRVSPLFSLIRSQGGLVYEVKDTAKINRIFEREDIQALLPSNLKLLWDVKPRVTEDGTELLELNAIKKGRGGKAPLTGEAVTNASKGLDQATRPAVFLKMSPSGGKDWARLTRENVNRRIAIVLDNYVYSAPNVEQEITGGSSIISGSFTTDEADDLANILKAGSLPAPTRIVKEATIGATLGKQAQVQGIVSIFAGLAVVVIFIVAYYAGGGMVANLALLFNIFFVIGVLAQFGSVLTLPGIAGIVLTIGMSIDANVLIFERIREELRNGSDLRPAISKGYDKAFSSIIDSNVTTFLTGVILFLLGQGPVKGFAITLMIGIGCSFFSAVFITRVFIEWLARKGNDSKLSFSTPISKGFMANVDLNLIGKRKFAYIGSTIFIIFGMLIMFMNPIKMGVDFTGGRSYIVKFADPVVSSDIKVALVDNFPGAGVEVKTHDGTNAVKITTNYLVEDESDEADIKVQNALISGISEFSGLSYIDDDSKVDDATFGIAGTDKVGASIADDIKNASQQSIFFSLIVIFLYILIRFRKWQFGTGAIIALFHDTLVVLSAFAIAGALGFNFEIDQVFIAAMLTIIGYSINDTVVVFDRIRETFANRAQADFIDNINRSINKTMSRTLITSFTTLIVMIVLFVWGGEVLKGFSFAMIIGILIGTYSSVFIATPIVVDFTKNKISKH